MATRKDVAAAAGVSVTAVTRALNNSGYISADKRDRIIRIAKELGYDPNPVAVSLYTGRSNHIMFYHEDLTGAYMIQMLHGIMRQSAKKGYYLMTEIQENINFHKSKELLIDGIIFVSEYEARKYMADIGSNFHIPSVAIVENPDTKFSKSTPIILNDNEVIIEKAINYLHGKGHVRIGYAGLSRTEKDDWRYSYWKIWAKQRFGDGYRDFAFLPNLLHESDEKPEIWFNRQISYGFSYSSCVSDGRMAARMYAGSGRRATALIAYNDDMAHAMIKEFELLGIRVPEDVSVMGIDGTYIRDRENYVLTSVGTFPDRTGAMAVDLLLDVIEGKNDKYRVRTKPKILEGNTVKSL